MGMKGSWTFHCDGCEDVAQKPTNSLPKDWGTYDVFRRGVKVPETTVMLCYGCQMGVLHQQKRGKNWFARFKALFSNGPQ